MTDKVNFLDDDEEDQPVTRPWCVLITDDEPDVHIATRFALAGKKIHGRPVFFIDAYTGQEAKEIIANNLSVDFMFLDAVMETDDAGLRCAEYIKNVLKRKIPTIVMRTGFANWELEQDKNAFPYIDDYILKSETTFDVIINLLEKWLPKD